MEWSGEKKMREEQRRKQRKKSGAERYKKEIEKIKYKIKLCNK